MIFIFRLNKKTLKLFESFDGMHFFVDEILLNIYNEFFDQSVHFSTLRLSTIFFFHLSTIFGRTYFQYLMQFTGRTHFQYFMQFSGRTFFQLFMQFTGRTYFQYLQYLKKKFNSCNKLAAVQRFQFSGYFFHRIF